MEREVQKVRSMQEGDIAWAYTTVPESANPRHPPIMVTLLSSFPWGEKTLWLCKLPSGSQVHCDEAHLSHRSDTARLQLRQEVA